MNSQNRPVVVVTGTSRGLGLQLVKMFLDAGYLVFGCSRGEPTFVSDAYRHSAIDIGCESQVRAWARQVKKDAGRIDLLVCNAGVMESVLPFTMTPSRLMESCLSTNVAGSFYILREFGKILTVQQAGRIVAISSVMTRLHEPGTSVYSATKSAIEEMIRVFARELAGANITCNIIAPGLIATDSADTFGEDWRERMLALQTINRPIEVEEVFHAICFFASSDSASITGQTLYMGVVN